MSYSKELQKLDSCFATSMTLTQSYALFSFRRHIKNHYLKSISSQALIAHFAKELLTFVNKRLIYPSNFHPTNANKPPKKTIKYNFLLQPIEFTDFYQPSIFQIRI